MPDLTIDGVKTKISGLTSFALLEPEYYAQENGAAHVVAKDIRKKMKVTQLRKFFGHIKKIHMKYKGEKVDKEIDKSELYLLLPELAYALGRDLISPNFYELMKVSLGSKIRNVSDFNRFVEFLSAILAYHKMEKGE